MNVKDLDSHSHDILLNCNGSITSPRYQMQFISSFSLSGEGWPNVESTRVLATYTAQQPIFLYFFCQNRFSKGEASQPHTPLGRLRRESPVWPSVFTIALRISFGLFGRSRVLDLSKNYRLFYSLTRHQFGLEEGLESKRWVSRSANRPQNQYFQNSIRYLTTTNQVNVLPLNSLFCFIYFLFTLLHPMKPLKLHVRDKLKQHVLLAISSENNMNVFLTREKV